MKRILVTGARGLIGRHALAALAESGAALHAVGRDGTGPGHAMWHACDLTDATQATALVHDLAPTHLLHLAWTTAHGKFWTDPANLDWVAASLALLRAFAASGGQRAVFAGSCAEYDFAAPAPWAEDAPLAPATLYGTAKDSLRRLAGKFCADQGISFAWGRVFLLAGQGEAPARLVPSLAASLRAGRPAATGPGSRVLDLMDTRDAGRAFAALLAQQDAAGAVNIATGKGVSLTELATRMAELAGRPDLAAPGTLPARAGDPPVLLADVTRLHALGFRPAHTLDDTLRAALGVVPGGA
jgi:nucleoside-diphosphate-sugar epimerase